MGASYRDRRIRLAGRDFGRRITDPGQRTAQARSAGRAPDGATGLHLGLDAPAKGIDRARRFAPGNFVDGSPELVENRCAPGIGCDLDRLTCMPGRAFRTPRSVEHDEQAGARRERLSRPFERNGARVQHERQRPESRRLRADVREPPRTVHRRQPVGRALPRAAGRASEARMPSPRTTLQPRPPAPVSRRWPPPLSALLSRANSPLPGCRSRPARATTTG